jgi:hypothetical protein
MRLEVRLQDETVWLSQRLISELYQVGVGTINHHIKSIYEDRELSPEATIRQYRIVQTEGGRQVERLVEYYNRAMAWARARLSSTLRIWAAIKANYGKESEGAQLGPDVFVASLDDISG